MAGLVAVEWSDLSHAGAFLVGMLTGIVLTLRLAKLLLELMRQERKKGQDDAS